MQNDFPRIYSLSTIGIKQHFNTDYLFHPYRTDFSGESGSGKSMIADMIQLILVGSSEFKSATDGNKDRDVKGMLLASKGNSSSRGYIFLNIEVKPKYYIVIGVYIESTSNAAEMFIIQNGYDWEDLTPLNTPVFTKDLIVNDKIDTLNNLCEKIDFARIKSFKRRIYHQLLYNYNILSLDLTKDETLKTYASILRSFSRGKGFKTESENLKKFLFGDDQQNIIIEKYKEEVNNINNDFHEHKRYLDEIRLINEKQTLLKNVLEKSKVYKTTYSEYLIKRYNYWNTLRKVSIVGNQKKADEIEQQVFELNFIEKQLNKLHIIEFEDLLDANKKVIEIDERKNSNVDIKDKFINISQSKESIKKVEGWLKLNDNELEKVKAWFSFQVKENSNRIALGNFESYLRNNSMLNSFDTSNWLIDFDKENRDFHKEIEKIESEITELESLSKFSDVGNPESLLRWATENLEFPISHEVESVLIYFQKHGKRKPPEKSENRYVPFPENLFENIEAKIKDKTNFGFWLNLDGVYEYIEHSVTQVLNVKNPKLIIAPLLELKESVENRLSTLNLTKKNKSDYKDILFRFSNLENHIDLYRRRNELSVFNIEETIKDVSEKSFNEFIQLYIDKENILNEYDNILNDYEDFLSQNSLLEKYNEKIKKIGSKLFGENIIVDINLIETRISECKNQLFKQEENLTHAHINEILLEEKYSKEINNESKLLSQKFELEKNIGQLQNDVKKYDNDLSTANQELNQTKNLNQELFKSEIEFLEDEENINPETGGQNSLKYKAEQSKISYEEYLKIITEKTPYDESISIGKLANYMLPTVFPTSTIDEHLISSNIVERLSKLTQDIQEIGSRKVEILGSIFNEVYKIYNGYLTKISEIDSYLRKKNRVITGGNRASLTFKKSTYYPDSWLSNFRKQLNSQMGYTGLFSDLREEIDINDMMIKAFQQLGGNSKVEPEDLMNPKSYFDLEFDLKLDNDEINSGSNGQTYAANALLCLARLSLIEEKGKTGLKIMPIDEAEGLGSNYDMLHELAKNEKYQIVTMAIETAGEIIDGGQYIYIMNENNIADIDSYVPPLGIFSDAIIEDIGDYINNISSDG